VLQIDHVVYAVGDLDAAATRVREEFGLASVPGGVHPQWGTGNRIIPLGDGRTLTILGVHLTRPWPLRPHWAQPSQAARETHRAVCGFDVEWPRRESRGFRRKTRD